MLTIAFVALMVIPVAALMLLLGMAEIEAALFNGPEGSAPDGDEEGDSARAPPRRNGEK
ncbi:hypothetical protein ACTMTI_29105 [Nonomuraea sp. H19]|uniref:hypothetical protein n=1 Tax=Nonomuraea sp. H19 TaxID=3452206 RepID=UPI003F8CC58D